MKRLSERTLGTKTVSSELTRKITTFLKFLDEIISESGVESIFELLNREVGIHGFFKLEHVFAWTAVRIVLTPHYNLIRYL